MPNLHYRPSICPCRIRVENALKTHVKRISFPTRISKIQPKPTIHMRWTAVQRSYLLTNQQLKYSNAVQRTIRVETHGWTANQKGSSALPDLLRVNQWLFHSWNQDNSENIFPQNALFIVSFSFLCQWHSLIFGHRCEIFHVSWLHIPLHLFNIGYNSTMWTSSSCSVQPYQTGSIVDLCYQI